jgi:hypothetical protein
MIPILAQAAATSATDKWEHYSFVATVFAAIWAAVWAIRQWKRESQWRRQDQEKERQAKHEELAQRKQELRWKQAELARKMTDAIFDYPPSNDAWRMVDGEIRYKEDGNEMQIDMALVRGALPKPWSDECGGPQVYARWCFDALFYYLEQLEHALQLDILNFEDLEASASYYVSLMAEDKKLFQDYAELIGFRRAVAFLERFADWRNART